ncbi:hypothetical protein HNV11_16355 [Spirosoma taeanense]|uniref:Uncharacterized protein n=1 Tax=Spirosoma taeanense TaxID=2735870 RepID=A0A6M5YC04_9BACT|nr:hypothetical protein [Spirosoma taeanense]QJW90836.1 hypothetical protein HNV11_16355 [Spirosoma taeanense]
MIEENMPSHYIHYLPRRAYLRFLNDKQSPNFEQQDRSHTKDVDEPWYAEDQRLDSGFLRPTYHITRSNSGPAEAIKPGDTIWIISQLFSPWGHLPPALDAKVDVQEVINQQDGTIKFIAAASSIWFPLADISKILNELYTVPKIGQPTHLMSDKNKPVGIYLQSIRKLESSTRLLEWSNKLKKRDFKFISYRIKDGTECAYKCAQKLLKKKKAVYWDRWSLPRRLVERRETVDDKALNLTLESVISDPKCSTVYGIESPLYSDPTSYAQREATLAKQLGKYLSVPC